MLKEMTLKSRKLDRLRERREQVEAQVRACRVREVAILTGRQLSQEPMNQTLEDAVKRARRKLQLNRLGVAQKRRSIRTMQAKIADTECAMKPLLDKEPALDAIRAAAERHLDEYRQRVADSIAATLV